MVEETEERKELIAEAKELGVTGVLENMKEETLKRKIAEAKGETSKDKAETSKSGLFKRKFGKFKTKGN